MAEYADFVDGVSIHLSKCPRPIILNAIKYAVMKFCNDSRVWVIDAGEIDVTPENRIYSLDIPSETTVCYVHSLFGRDECSDRIGRGERRAYYRYHIDHPNILVVDEKYIHTRTLNPVVSLKPSQNALSCADIIFDEYSNAITSGAVAHLQMQPLTTWTEPNMAQAHLQIFMQGIEDARQTFNRGFGISEPNYRTRPSYL
jgi:hypothetical protein